MENNKKEYHIHIHYSVQNEVIDKDVPVSEETYRTYRRPEWREKRQAERLSRCQIKSEKGGMRRCTEDCSTCEYFRNGTPLSIERMQEDGMDTPDQNSDVEEAVIYNELLAALFEALSDLDPKMQAIANAIMDGLKDNEAYEILGYKAPSSYNYWKQKLLNTLRERLEKYL